MAKPTKNIEKFSELSVYVTRCNRNTSEEDIKKHALSIGINPEGLVIRKLVAENADIQRLNFVSFRVGVSNENDFQTLMVARN